jgi:glycosyltransferase involved in cell wall biosynthesis
VSDYPGKTVGIVIPAFNEAKNLFHVMDVVCRVRELKQIVIVDDGSTDSTISIANHYVEPDPRVIVLTLPKNQGKASALLAGVQCLQTDFVLFLDADLLGLRPYHLLQLSWPLEADLCEMSIALFRHGRILTTAAHRLTPNLSGQRGLRRDEAERALIPLAKTRYGVEIGLTAYARERGWRVKRIFWEGVTHITKEQKNKRFIGIHNRWQMYQQIISVFATKKNQWRILPPFRSKHVRSKSRRINLSR